MYIEPSWIVIALLAMFALVYFLTRSIIKSFIGLGISTAMIKGTQFLLPILWGKTWESLPMDTQLGFVSITVAVSVIGSSIAIKRASNTPAPNKT